MVFEGRRIAISGGAGVIGTALVSKLVARGAKVWVGDLKPRPDSFVAEVIYRQGDLNYLSAAELAAFAPEIFIHLAATFERSVETPEYWSENYHHNVRLSHHLASLLRASAVKRVLFASSYLCYDPALYLFATAQRNARSLVESDITSPRNLCGAAKYYHELELQFLARSNPDCSYLLARIFRGYGRGSRDVISRWIRDLLQGRAIDVFRPEGIFDFTYSEDSAEALVQLAVLAEGGIVNVGSGIARPVADVLAVLRQHFPDMQVRNGESEIDFEASQAGTALLEHLTGWRPSYTLETAIPQIIEYERARLRNAPVAACADGLLGDAILITSVSRKVPLVQAVRRAAQKVGGSFRLIGADANPACIASHFVDHFWQMPPLATLSIDELIGFCRANAVGCIIPTRDGELEFFAQASEALRKARIRVMISSSDAVSICEDKLCFAEVLSARGIPAIPTFTAVDSVPGDRLVVKERRGAGAAGLRIDVTRAAARDFGAALAAPVYQPYITGREFSVDVYVDASGRCHGAVARHRELVVNGESQVTTTQRHPTVEALCDKSAELLGLRGHAMFQLIEDANGILHLIECNARFGGASTLSIAAGLDSLYWFLLEARGASLASYPFARTTVERRQVRYANDLITDVT